MSATQKIAGLALVALGIGVFPLVLNAQNIRITYRYDRLSVNYEIEPDGTIAAEELQTMLYQRGAYNNQWRNIYHGDDFSISDVVVYDGALGEPMTFASTTLDDTDPSSWGKYAFIDEDGYMKITWYFDTADRVHTWVVRYRVHGAIAFFDDHDEFNWEVISNFDVPVDTVELTVHLPGIVTIPSSKIFSTGDHDYYIDRPNESTFRFRVSDIAAKEKVTIQIGWQKGLIHPRVSIIPLLLRIPLVQYALAGLVLLILAAVGYKVVVLGFTHASRS